MSNDSDQISIENFCSQDILSLLFFFCFDYFIFWRLNCLLVQKVKEKTIAARRSQVKTLIFPAANRRDFDELASNVKEGLEVHFVDDYNQIFELAFDKKQTEE